MLRALRDVGHEVTVMGPLPSVSYFTLRTLNKAIKKTSGYFLDPSHAWRSAKEFSRAAERRAKGQRLDWIFAPASSSAFVCAEFDCPVIYYTDATFKLLVDSYPAYSKMLRSSIKAGNAIERAALQRARYSLVPSRWAAASALTDYQTPEDRVGIIPMGANLVSPPSREQALNERDDAVFHMLFIGVWWERKGGSIALETLKELRRRGIPAVLTVCGCNPPEKASDVQTYSFLDKSNPTDTQLLHSLFLRSHVFILPTRADASPMVLSEAAAYGLPCLSTRVGGVPEIVLDGETGNLFPLDAPVSDYADAAQRLWENKDLLRRQRSAARDRYEQYLQWSAWALTITSNYFKFK